MTIAFAYGICRIDANQLLGQRIEVFPNTDNDVLSEIQKIYMQISLPVIVYDYNIEFVNSERSLTESRGDKISLRISFDQFHTFCAKTFPPY